MSILDSIMNTGITMDIKKVSMFPAIITSQDKPIMASKQKANDKNQMETFLDDKKLLFGANKEIRLSDEFVEWVTKISHFTRTNDITYPYSVINKEMAEFDNIRTGIGLVSTVLSFVSVYAMPVAIISLLADAVSASPLVLPATDLFDLRGPIQLNPVTKQMYSSKFGQNGERYYAKYDNVIQTDKLEFY